MGLDSKVGFFILNGTVGNQIVRPLGLNFTPLLWEFYATHLSADGISVDAHLGWGAAIDASNMFAISSNSEDGQGTSDATNITTDDKCFVLLNPGLTTVLFDAEFVSSEFGGCTINIITAPASAPFHPIIGYKAWGGSGVEAALGTFTAKGSAGSDSFTGAGFVPQYFKFGCTGQTSIPASGNGGIFAIGETSGVGEEGAAAAISEDGVGTSNTKRTQRDDRSILITDDAGANLQDALFESFDADGGTVDWQNASTALIIVWIALRGAQFQVGSFFSQAAAGQFAAVEDLDFRPKVGSFFSFGNTETDSNVDGMKLYMGAADKVLDDANVSGRFVVGAVDEDGQGTTDADQQLDTTSIYKNIDFAQAALGDIDFVQWEPDGLTADETDADAAANEIIYSFAGDAIGKDITQPAKISYSMRVRDNRQAIIEEGTGREVPGELVRPNNWLRVEDLLPLALPAESDLSRDPQITLVVSVIYQEPFGITITGSRSTQPDVFFAGLGLGGVAQT